MRYMFIKANGVKSIPSVNGTCAIAMAGVTLVTIYSVQFVAARYSLQSQISSTGLTVLRYLVAGALFVPYVIFFDGHSKIRKLGFRKIIALSLCAGFPYLLVINKGISLTSAGYVSAVGPGSIVLFSFLLPFVFMKDKPDKAAWFSTATISLGILMYVFNTFFVESISLLGTGLFVLQGFMFSMYGVLLRRWSVDAVLGTSVVSIVSCVPAVYYLSTTEMGFSQASSSEIYVQVVVQGVLAGAVAIFLFSYLVQKIGPQRTSLFMPCVPIITSILGYYLLGELLTIVQSVGIIAMVIGMAAPGFLTLRRSYKKIH